MDGIKRMAMGAIAAAVLGLELDAGRDREAEGGQRGRGFPATRSRRRTWTFPASLCKCSSGNTHSCSLKTYPLSQKPGNDNCCTPGPAGHEPSPVRWAVSSPLARQRARIFSGSCIE